MNHHSLIVGKSGSGKSEDQLSKLKAMAMSGDTAIILLEPHGNLAKDFLLHLAQMHQLDRVIYDRLADTDKVVGYQFLKPSSNPNEFERFAENDDQMRKFTNLLVRRGGAKNTAQSPMIEFGLFSAIKLYLHQKEPVPLYWLGSLYTPFSSVMSHMIENCTDPDTKAQFEGLRFLNPQTFDYKTGAGDRRLRAVTLNPSFAIRCTETFDFDEFLGKKGILILDGEGCNPDVASVMMSCVTLKTIDSCRRCQHRTQIVMDEANNAGLIGLQESQALAEVRKWNLGFSILVQILNFPDEEITINVLQNTQEHTYFCQGSPESARQAAADIAKRILDPLKVHHIEYRVRNVDDGFERIANGSSSVTKDGKGKKISESSSSNYSIVKKSREVVDEQARYMSLSDQEALVLQRVLGMSVGERWVAGEHAPHYRDMEKHLWHHLSGILSGEISQAAIRKLKQSKLNEAIARVKESPAYKTPFLIPIPSKPETEPQASAARRLKGKRGTK